MIRRITWSDEADRGLSRALPNALIRSIVAAEVQSGTSMLWDCENDTHHAYVVTRVDANPTEFVIVAFEGTGMLTFGPEFVAAARSRGIPLRAHVTNPIVARLLRKLGMRVDEWVLRAAA